MGDGQKHPALVAGAAVVAEGVDEGDDKQPQQQEHPPPLFHQVLDVDEGDPHVGHDAHTDEHGLFLGEVVQGIHIAGGGVDEHQPHEACQDAQAQQDHVALFEKFFECAHRLQGGAPSLRKTANQYSTSGKNMLYSFARVFEILTYDVGKR